MASKFEALIEIDQDGNIPNLTGNGMINTNLTLTNQHTVLADVYTEMPVSTEIQRLREIHKDPELPLNIIMWIKIGHNDYIPLAEHKPVSSYLVNTIQDVAFKFTRR
ncbi:uncharacterized protein LOC131931177 [Physella acuta]|uniref:uncharacterized protein LOC131931177 n=1 Tax=Physella acuta TaxID=109671 RepID=UPI0027DAE817|nr:uncharacterized protein LOC131931177 [Physella acuta]